jgi:hypothetical protein
MEILAALIVSMLPWVIIYLLLRPLIREARELWDAPRRLRELESKTDSLEEMVLRMHHRMKDMDKGK